MKTFTIILLEIVFPNDDNDIQEFGRCITPHGEPAKCIFLHDCYYLFTLLTVNPLTDGDRTYLSKSQCGYKNGFVLVRFNLLLFFIL